MINRFLLFSILKPINIVRPWLDKVYDVFYVNRKMRVLLKKINKGNQYLAQKLKLTFFFFTSLLIEHCLGQWIEAHIPMTLLAGNLDCQLVI